MHTASRLEDPSSPGGRGKMEEEKGVGEEWLDGSSETVVVGSGRRSLIHTDRGRGR